MLVDPLVEAFGPFLIPAAVFVIGAIGYGLLILLTRYGLLPSKQSEDT